MNNDMLLGLRRTWDVIFLTEIWVFTVNNSCLHLVKPEQHPTSPVSFPLFNHPDSLSPNRLGVSREDIRPLSVFTQNSIKRTILYRPLPNNFGRIFYQGKKQTVCQFNNNGLIIFDGGIQFLKWMQGTLGDFNVNK